MTDTDSLLLQIKTPNLVADIQDLQDHFDTSNYPQDHVLYDGSRQNQLFLIKDECGGRPMTQFVGLRSKCYAYRVIGKETTEEKKTAKGISKNTIRSDCSLSDYLKALEEHQRIYKSAMTIRSNHHVLSSTYVRKLSFNPFDDKRYLHSDFTSDAHGHYRNRV